uniref:Vacuolar protein sorting-associated protein 13A-like n=1 Tax=Saccoglossus kowalevskii TaxID=10224 RepID=A0ABM0M7I3_SACKO|nr:PREDICTED: vacuolar protein sorting-associated protein 13A-like [Saccoglossus kowalevskii]
MSFVEKMVASIVNNIQVTLNNVHIRYEDSVTNPGNPVAFGVMLQSLTAQTTDDLWQPTTVDATVTIMRKLIKMENLAAYWNSPVKTRIGSFIGSGKWLSMMQEVVVNHKVNGEEVDFLIHPISTEARISFDKSSKVDFLQPKLMLEIVTEEIATALSRKQYIEILDLIQAFKLMEVNKLYRKYHPNVQVKGNAKAWWHYAYSSVLEEHIRPWSWERIKEHRSMYKRYKNVYKKKIEYPDHADRYKTELRQLEERMDIANILMAREHARLEFVREAPEREKRRKKEKDGSWSIWNWFSSSTDSEAELDIEESDDSGFLDTLSDKEKEDLYKAIGYDESELEREEDKPIEYVERKFTFSLNHCVLTLKNPSEIMKFSFHNMITSLEQRPSADAFRLKTNTDSVLIQGCTPNHELIPILTSEKTRTNGYGTQVFGLEFETNPLTVNADSSVAVNMEPVEIIYHEHTISEVMSFFTVPQVDVEELKAAASNTLSELAVVTKSNLMFAIDNHKTIHVDVDMKSPYIIIPEHGAIDKGGNLLILDLGSLNISSDLQTTAPQLEDATMTEIEQHLYDRFTITVSDIQVLFASADEDWHNAHALKDSEFHILPSTLIQVSVFLSVKPDYKVLPQTKLEAVVPSLKVTVSDNRLKALLKFGQTLPMPATKVTIASSTLPALDKKHIKSVLSANSLKKLKKSVSRKPKPVATLDEIDAREEPVLSSQPSLAASDHSDEEVIDWASVLEVPAYEDTASNTNTISMLLRFVIREVVLSVSKVQAPKPTVPSEDITVDSDFEARHR